METIYLSKKVDMGMNDLEIWEDEGIYSISIESLIYYRNTKELKEYYSELLNDCKKDLEQKYKLKVDEIKNSHIFPVKYELEHNIDLEMYSIWFKTPEFTNIESVYIWISKAIKIIHNIK